MEITVEPSKTYAVTTSGSCTVTDADGLELCTASSGSQAFFVATTPTVTISDDGAKVSRANFKHALAALGLLGGGADKLPAGYMQLAFLESTGNQYINTGIVLNSSSDCTVEAYGEGYICGSMYATNLRFMMAISRSQQDYRLFIGYKDSYEYLTNEQGVRRHRYRLNEGDVYFDGSLKYSFPKGAAFDCTSPCYLFAYNRLTVGATDQLLKGRIYSFKLKGKADYIPALDPAGVPCMYDCVTSTALKNVGTGSFVAGFTLAQARKLSKLPAGTTLTVSLPVGYDSDEGVVDALAQARENGCVLTIRTYEATGAAATFALRRVWVRKTQAEYGSYVAADGSRWQVEWCVDVIGADPEELGYERFRSVDAAADYWELTPFMTIDPETEPEN